MKKEFAKELILPSFWLFFFICFPEKENKIKVRKENSPKLKQQESAYPEPNL